MLLPMWVIGRLCRAGAVCYADERTGVRVSGVLGTGTVAVAVTGVVVDTGDVIATLTGNGVTVRDGAAVVVGVVVTVGIHIGVTVGNPTVEGMSACTWANERSQMSPKRGPNTIEIETRRIIAAAALNAQGVRREGETFWRKACCQLRQGVRSD